MRFCPGTGRPGRSTLLRVFLPDLSHPREEHPGIAKVQVELAQLLAQTERAAEAETQLRQATAILDQAVGPESWQSAQARSLLGAVLAQTGRKGEATPLLEESLARLEATVGAEHPETRAARQRLSLHRSTIRQDG